MSTSRTKYSSQRPRTRAPPAGSSKSGSRRSGYGTGEIPLSAATSSTSSASSEEEQRKSHVSFARQAPSLAPSDSVSRCKPRPRQSSSGQSSDRRTSRSSGTTWRSSKSRGSRASSGHGSARSGSGSALTEENLERLQNRSRLDAVAETAEESYSNQREGAQSSRRTTRQYEQRTSARSNPRETNAQTNNGQWEGRASGRYGAAKTQNADTRASGPKASSQNRSRKDSLSPEGTLPASQQQSGSNAASEQDASGGGWQRKVIVTTSRWPDGREVREREVRMIRTPQT